ncbi:MAG: thioredoxin family protein [Pseudolysinimonas sp.]
MDKRILAVVVGIAAVILATIGVVALALPRDSVNAASTPPSTAVDIPSTSVAPSETPSASLAAGAYVDYTETAISQAAGRTFLFFHAPWCPQCRSIESDILAEGVPAGVTIIKVDYDTHQDLRQQYGVTLQTTFVEVDASGNALQSYVAYNDPHLDAVLTAMI